MGLFLVILPSAPCGEGSSLPARWSMRDVPGCHLAAGTLMALIGVEICGVKQLAAAPSVAKRSVWGRGAIPVQIPHNPMPPIGSWGERDTATPVPAPTSPWLICPI